MRKATRWTAEQGNVPQNNRRLIFIIVLVVVTALVLIGVLLWKARVEVSKPIPDETQSSASSDVSQPQSVQGRYLFNGTIVLARAVERDAAGDVSQPFKNIETFNPDQYDAMTLDWECPSTEDEIPYQTQVQNLLFNCHVKWLPEVAKHFEIVSLANNHSGDLGEAAFVQTQKNLANAGIQTYGNYDPADKNDSCEVIALPVRIQMPDGAEEKARLPMAFCAWHYFFRSPQPGELEVMERYADIMPVFGFMHAGAEYYPTAAADQEELARRIIDLGAEFVIGNSPHWVQNSEVYKGKPIFYSTGNFIFDQIDYETKRGLSIDVDMTVPYTDNVKQWLDLGADCISLDDTCLEKAEAANLEKFDIELTYDVVGSSGGARTITTRADETLQKAIEERVNWAETREKLGQTAGD